MMCYQVSWMLWLPKLSTHTVSQSYKCYHNWCRRPRCSSQSILSGLWILPMDITWHWTEGPVCRFVDITSYYLEVEWKWVYCYYYVIEMYFLLHRKLSCCNCMKVLTHTSSQCSKPSHCEVALKHVAGQAGSHITLASIYSTRMWACMTYIKFPYHTLASLVLMEAQPPCHFAATTVFLPLNRRVKIINIFTYRFIRGTKIINVKCDWIIF